MGKTIRWLRGLFGLKRDRETEKPSQNLSLRSVDKRGSSFGRSPENKVSDDLCNNPGTIPPNLSESEAAWLKSYYSQTEQEQSKHAIAVAAATAAAADAAVAAAQAAVAVVRLTSHGRAAVFSGGTGLERLASVKIQTFFRGYLARKALRALKGLVKLQAAVRGFLVRKQATATLHSMQALIRAQSTVLKARKSMDNYKTNNESYYTVPTHSRRLSACLDEEQALKIVEIDTGRPKSRSRIAESSPLPCRRISIPDNHYYYNNSYNHNNNYSSSSEWGDQCRYSTAQSTPRFFCGECAPPTPAKSVCGECPNYMADTKSFKAKLRSYSAPKQRPEPGPRKRLSLATAFIDPPGGSFAGVRMRRSCSNVNEPVNFKEAVVANLHYRDRDRDHNLNYN